MVQAGSGEPVPDDLVELGRILSAYGVRGWVKIAPHSQQSDILLKTKTWWIAPSAQASASVVVPVACTVMAARRHSASVVAQVAGCTDRDGADALRGATVHIPRSAFPQPAEGEYYWVDLIGCTLFGQDDAGAVVPLGTVNEVMDNGAHAVLKVSNGTLVPFVDAHVLAVDMAARRIDTNWPADF
ncbi:ribosome maturation factor RimM [Alcaligenaceae bacterium SJ-26]|nr:ribosome maturation factor RimM [Alcaligenaceae bacterium SJ-26]